MSANSYSFTQNHEFGEDARMLDLDQRAVFDKMVKYAKMFRTPGLHPSQIMLKVNGKSGTGKTHLMNTIAKACEYWLRYQNAAMSDLNKPVVLKLGQALESLAPAFHILNEDNQVPLPNLELERMRNYYSDLTNLLIDDFSIGDKKWLHHLDERLKDIKKNQDNFGGISIIIFGDFGSPVA